MMRRRPAAGQPCLGATVPCMPPRRQYQRSSRATLRCLALQALASFLQSDSARSGSPLTDNPARIKHMIVLQVVSTGVAICGASPVAGDMGHQPHQAAEQLGHRWRAAGRHAAATAAAGGAGIGCRDVISCEFKSPLLLTLDRASVCDWALQDESMSPNPTDGREYKMALARTRQAVAVHKAMQFNAQGSPARSAGLLQPCHQLAVALQPDIAVALTAGRPGPTILRGDPLSGCRAMVELRRALQENSTVREPLLNARYEKQEVSTPDYSISVCSPFTPTVVFRVACFNTSQSYRTDLL
jgi:hypothetical protein